MLAVSTSCLDPTPSSWPAAIADLLELPVQAHEFDVRVPLEERPALLTEVRGAGRAIVSMCDHPPHSLDSTRPLHSALDDSERSRAVATSIETLEWAARCECPIVVMKPGRTSVPFDFLQVQRLIERRRWWHDEGAEWRRHFEGERQRSAPRHFDALCFALDRVLRAAERLEITIAVENPADPGAMPSAQEFLRLEAEFGPQAIRPWYHHAHGHRQTVHGFAERELLATTVIDPSLGAYAVDSDELSVSDALLLPGTGKVEFGQVLDPVATRPMVLQPRPADSCEAIEQALVFLEGLGWQGPPSVAAEPFPIFGSK